MFDQMVEELAGIVGRLAEVPSEVGEDAARVDLIAELERVKAATAAAQLGVVDDFATSQEASNRALGVEERVARRGVPEQVGLARGVAPATAARQVSQAAGSARDVFAAGRGPDLGMGGHDRGDRDVASGW